MTVSVREMMERMEEEPGGRKALEVMGHRAVLGSNVYRLRTERGWTQGELAERAGMAQPRIANIENHLGNPRLDTISRVALALGVEPGVLLRRAEEEFPVILMEEPWPDVPAARHRPEEGRELGAGG
jgi:transcriptional regulator with XRE-family HTH domain